MLGYYSKTKVCQIIVSQVKMKAKYIRKINLAEAMIKPEWACKTFSELVEIAVETNQVHKHCKNNSSQHQGRELQQN